MLYHDLGLFVSKGKKVFRSVPDSNMQDSMLFQNSLWFPGGLLVIMENGLLSGDWPVCGTV